MIKKYIYTCFLIHIGVELCVSCIISTVPLTQISRKGSFTNFVDKFLITYPSPLTFFYLIMVEKMPNFWLPTLLLLWTAHKVFFPGTKMYVSQGIGVHISFTPSCDKSWFSNIIFELNSYFQITFWITWKPEFWIEQ